MCIKLVGHIGSPYSRKLRAYLRYKQIPFEWIQNNTSQVLDLPPPIIPIIPVVYYERENYSIGHTDSTPLIQSMNKTCIRRSTSPSDPALDFLNHLLEDFSDEWLNKIMYYYRSKYNGFRNSEFLLLASNPSMDENELKELAGIFQNRQTHNLPQIIGTNDSSGDFLENHYIKIIKLFDDVLSNNNFIFGSRPSSADFGFYGQFSQLILTDQTSRETYLRNGMRLRPWCEFMDDLSGIDLNTTSWVQRDVLKGSDVHKNLLQEVNDVYLPVLYANFLAFKNGKSEFAVDLRGIRWKQKVNKYHAKCIRQLHNSYNALLPEDKNFVKSLGVHFDVNGKISSRL